MMIAAAAAAGRRAVGGVAMQRALAAAAATRGALAHTAAAASASVRRLPLASPRASIAPHTRALHTATTPPARHLSSWSAGALGARLSSALGGSRVDSASSLPPPFAPLPLPPLSNPASWHPQLGLFGCGLKKPSDFERMAEDCVKL